MGKLDEALKQLDAALALAPAATIELRSQLVALKAHFGSLFGKGGKPDASDKPAAALRIVAQNVLSTKLTGEAVKTAIADAWKRADPDPAKPALGLPLLELAQLAWAATASGNDELAGSICARVSTSQSLRPRVWAELARSQAQLDAVAPQDSLSESSVRTRQKCLDTMEQCISNFVRVEDMDGVHAACRHALKSHDASFVYCMQVHCMLSCTHNCTHCTFHHGTPCFN